MVRLQECSVKYMTNMPVVMPPCIGVGKVISQYIPESIRHRIAPLGSKSPQETVREELFLLQNCGAGYIGNSPIFWRKNGSGYTQWIDDAELWTKEGAERQIESTRGTHSWQMWPIAEVEAVAKRTVDIQDLRKT